MLHFTGRILAAGLVWGWIGLMGAGLPVHASWQDQVYDQIGLEVTGFVEARQGWRLADDELQKDASIFEARLQLAVDKDLDLALVHFKGDLVGDRIEDNVRGELRELNTSFSPLAWMDVKAGRQTLTWGTGDLLFVNDLFPKDWEAFFIGRDDEYLKAPADAIKISLFADVIDLDLVYAPLHNASTFIDGDRISYFSPFLNRIAGRADRLRDEARDDLFEDNEYALRVSKNIGSVETRFYGYYGFWKTPEGFDALTGKATYPRLSVYGASLRAPVLGGIGAIEAGYYDSGDDRDGDDPLVRNSETRLLIGFEREIGKDLTGGLQYYLEVMDDYANYKDSLPGGSPRKDEWRHLITLRLTKLLWDQNLRLSFFGYYSPSDEDAYLRPKAHYKLTDAWALEVGGNIFWGEDQDTFFGQFEDATNAYAAVRWNY